STWVSHDSSLFITKQLISEKQFSNACAWMTPLNPSTPNTPRARPRPILLLCVSSTSRESTWVSHAASLFITKQLISEKQFSNACAWMTPLNPSTPNTPRARPRPILLLCVSSTSRESTWVSHAASLFITKQLISEKQFSNACAWMTPLNPSTPNTPRARPRPILLLSVSSTSRESTWVSHDASLFITKQLISEKQFSNACAWMTPLNPSTPNTPRARPRPILLLCVSSTSRESTWVSHAASLFITKQLISEKQFSNACAWMTPLNPSTPNTPRARPRPILLLSVSSTSRESTWVSHDASLFITKQLISEKQFSNACAWMTPLNPSTPNTPRARPRPILLLCVSSTSRESTWVSHAASLFITKQLISEKQFSNACAWMTPLNPSTPNTPRARPRPILLLSVSSTSRESTWVSHDASLFITKQLISEKQFSNACAWMTPLNPSTPNTPRARPRPILLLSVSSTSRESTWVSHDASLFITKQLISEKQFSNACAWMTPLNPSTPNTPRARPRPILLLCVSSTSGVNLGLTRCIAFHHKTADFRKAVFQCMCMDDTTQYLHAQHTARTTETHTIIVCLQHIGGQLGSHTLHRVSSQNS